MITGMDALNITVNGNCDLDNDTQLDQLSCRAK